MTRRKYLMRARLVMNVAVSSAINRIFESSCHRIHAAPGLTAKMLDIVNVHHSSTIAAVSLFRRGAVSAARFISAPAKNEIAVSFATGKVCAKDQASMCGYMKLTHVYTNRP